MTAHHFTVDVEEYFQVSALEPYVSRDSWLQRESRVERSVDVLLDLLDRFGSRGTLFVVGWIAKHHRRVVESIAAAGHEVASHGWGHRRVTQLNPREFRQSVRDSKQLLEDLIGKSVTGYRAPSFSIVRGGEWALDILVEEGYGYDSSLFPVRRAAYGYAGGQRSPYWIDRPAGRLAEVPPATLRIVRGERPGGWWCVFLFVSIPVVSSGSAPEPTRARARHVLYPSVGGRSTATSIGRWVPYSAKALRWPDSNGGSVASSAG